MLEFSLFVLVFDREYAALLAWLRNWLPPAAANDVANQAWEDFFLAAGNQSSTAAGPFETLYWFAEDCLRRRLYIQGSVPPWRPQHLALVPTTSDLKELCALWVDFGTAAALNPPTPLVIGDMCAALAAYRPSSAPFPTLMQASQGPSVTAQWMRRSIERMNEYIAPDDPLGISSDARVEEEEAKSMNWYAWRTRQQEVGFRGPREQDHDSGVTRTAQRNNHVAGGGFFRDAGPVPDERGSVE